MRKILLKLFGKSSDAHPQTWSGTTKDALQPFIFVTNKISSTKYNVFTFLPITLFVQLKSVINCFYLFNGMLQTFPSISTNSPLASLIPVIWVMLLGIVFELIADLRRWSSDKK